MNRFNGFRIIVVTDFENMVTKKMHLKFESSLHVNKHFLFTPYIDWDRIPFFAKCFHDT